MADNSETAKALAPGLKRKKRDDALVKLLGVVFAFLFAAVVGLLVGIAAESWIWALCVWIVVFLLLCWPLNSWTYRI